MPPLAETARKTRAWACYDCGKCTATCPIARAGSRYSPRRNVLAACSGRAAGALEDGALYQCLTCGLCDRRCPAEVHYTELMLKLREDTRLNGDEPRCPHGGALLSVMRMMARGGTQQDRLGWLTDDLQTDPEKGEVFYWSGCVMYYDAFFAEFQLSLLDAARAAVRLLNRLGVKPVVSPEERCCGHDLLWNGDRRSFESLARHNVKLVADSGAGVLVTSCAECLRAWKIDYQPYLDGKPPRILHLTEYLRERLPDLDLGAEGPRRVTFQDPCRLGRHLGIYEPPRAVLESLPGIELAEMRRSGPAGICCAGGTWSHCDRFAKKIQVERLREARGTGAAVLVTACPKCQIHLRCAMKDPQLGEEITIEMRDVAELVDESIRFNSMQCKAMKTYDQESSSTASRNGEDTR